MLLVLRIHIWPMNLHGLALGKAETLASWTNFVSDWLSLIWFTLLSVWERVSFCTRH